MSVISGKDGVVWLYGAAPGTPPVAVLVSDWSLELQVTRTEAGTLAGLSATELRWLMYGPALRARALTQAELLA